MRLKRPKKPPRFKEACSWTNEEAFCTARAKTKFECRTCEDTGKDVFTLFACAFHAEEVQKQIRRHALVKHPVNIVRVAAAVLKGDAEF